MVSYSYEKVKTFKYLDSLPTNQNYTHDQIELWVKKEENLRYYSV